VDKEDIVTPKMLNNKSMIDFFRLFLIAIPDKDDIIYNNNENYER